MAKSEKVIPFLFTQYNTVVKSELQKKFKIKNTMRVPKLEKIVINMGIGDAKEHANAFKNAVEEISLITGQKPIITYAKNAISNFKIRQGDPVGVTVTLRREKMYEFLHRFIAVATPRIRDFRGLPARGFDGRGNYNFGLTEQIVFPEIDYDKVDKIRGMNITIVTNSKTDEEAYYLLTYLGMPIRTKTFASENEPNEAA